MWQGMCMHSAACNRICENAAVANAGWWAKCMAI